MYTLQCGFAGGCCTPVVGHGQQQQSPATLLPNRAQTVRDMDDAQLPRVIPSTGAEPTYGEQLSGYIHSQQAL